MKVSEFDFDLPRELIAQYPLKDRVLARLMVLDRASGRITHHHFHEIGLFLSPGDLLVLNNTKVLRARLFGARRGTTADPLTRPSKIRARIEVLLVKELETLVWEALVRPGRKMRVGEEVVFGEGKLRATVIARGNLGLRTLRFECDGNFLDVVQSLGHVPLPPYIQRADIPEDESDYQTVYARRYGAVAAPTAGLHFSEALLGQLQAQGLQQTEITLHVGLGTFQPVHEEEVEQHVIHSEWFEVSGQAAAEINAARQRNGRVVAVGTTAVRTLEHLARGTAGELLPGHGETDLFIYPGYRFQVVQALVTNFHLPRSTLLMLVAAFAGQEMMRKAYRVAIEERYRFFSYGDAMLIR
jgi:S-adenosylmethionine:tRNA ribosyltransferase-isomerase